MAGVGLHGVAALPDRFLIFRAPARGQGMGNMLQGLATAMLLSGRYRRQLCVWWKLFEKAFEHRAAGRCPSKESIFTAAGPSGTALLQAPWVELWNFGETTPEEHWRMLLASDERTVVLQGNLVVEPDVRLGGDFDAAFGPTPALAALLRERGGARRIAAHLRVAGVEGEGRRGLFKEVDAWASLRRHLPSDTYVVSDSSDSYRELSAFASPPWGAVPHSATVRTISSSAAQILRTWAEWWSLREASVLLHTPSAFSESAYRFSTRAEWHCELGNVSTLVECARRFAAESESSWPIVQTEL